MSSRPRITLAMIVKDEAEFLAGCLATAKPYVDEMIVVDTGSTDRTKEIARSFGAKVFDHTWNDDFAEARNASLKHSNGEWILWLDADERLSGHSGQVMRHIVRRADVGGYTVTIRNYQDTECRHVVIHVACRLFRKLPGVEFQQRIHEQILEQIVRQGYKAEAADIAIDHFGYTPEVFERKGKNERNLAILEAELAENPYNCYLLYKQAATYGARMQYAEAAELYERCAAMDTEHKLGPALYFEWADTLTSLGRPEEALSVCDKAAETGFNHPQLYYVWGRALLTIMRFAEALEQFQRAVQIGRIHPHTSGDAGTWGHKAYEAMAASCLGLSDWQGAQSFAETALELMPRSIRALGVIAAACKAEGRIEDAKRALERIIRIDPNNADAFSDLARLAEEAGDYSKACRYIDRLVQLCPGRFHLHIWLAEVYEKLAMKGRALRHYEYAVELNPRCAAAFNNMALVLASQDDFPEALYCASQAIDLDPEWANGYFTAGDIFYQMGSLEDAGKAYERGLQLDPRNASGFFMLGNCYIKQGACEAAEMAYEQALVIKGDYDEAHNNLLLARAFMEQQISDECEAGLIPQAA